MKDKKQNRHSNSNIKIAIIFLLIGLILGINIKKVPVFNSNINNKIYKMYLQNSDGTYELKSSKDFPTDGYVLNTSRSTCTNGGIITQNADKTLSVDTSNPTKCTLYFMIDSLGTTKITDLAKTDTTNLAYDGTDDNNLRYIGSNPNNYIRFNGENWRIIGVFNNIEDSKGNKNTRLKIRRASSIGAYSWDTSASTINAGYGVNEWSQSKLMIGLNSGPYYNRESGTCYNDSNLTSVNCDFSNTGLNTEAKQLIDSVNWNLGTVNINSDANTTWTPSLLYERGKSANTGKQCNSGNGCNDTVTRTTKLVGSVGLIHPSDYGYATSGGSTTNRATCLNTSLYSWDGDNVSNCKDNDWIFDSNNWQ